MSQSLRQRLTRAAATGVVGAGFAAAAQYFIALPIGNQPQWLGTLASLAAVPAAYVTYPLSMLFETLTHHRLLDGRLLETSTPFGPAMRPELGDIALIAMGTVVTVGLAAYLAQGMSELLEARAAR